MYNIVVFLRRALCYCGVVGTFFCIALLLNFTATNPTGRRYSSANVPMATGQEDLQVAGDAAENVLSRDLKIPNNNAPDQRQCLCSSSYSANGTDCRVCIATSAVSSYRIPDFVTSLYLADSKNWRRLTPDVSYYARTLLQIRDYAAAAIELHRSLWIYVRVDTPVSNEVTQIVKSTGGDIIYYFTSPGYIDPTDREASIGLVLFGSMTVTGLILTTITQRKTSPAPHQHHTAPATSVQTADAFLTHVKQKARTTIAIEEARDDTRKDL